MGNIHKNKKLEQRLSESVLENYKWFSKFSPVEKLRIARKAEKFIKILKNAR